MIILLTIGFLIKHYLCDVYFQTYEISAGKRKPKLEGLKYLFIHSITHGSFTMLILTIFPIGTMLVATYDTSIIKLILLIAVLDFVLHFLIDRLKIAIERLTPIVYKSFKWKILLLFDQSLHGLCYIGYILMFVFKEN